MAKSTVKNDKILLIDLAPDVDRWPESWKGDQKDLVYGNKLLPYFKQFLNDLIAQGLSRTTLLRYIDDVGLLGRTIIKEVVLDQSHREKPLKKLLDSVADGGTLPDGIGSEDRMRSFERMCRRFESFLEKNQKLKG